MLCNGMTGKVCRPIMRSSWPFLISAIQRFERMLHTSVPSSNMLHMTVPRSLSCLVDLLI
jgi:hypothetical protein